MHIVICGAGMMAQAIAFDIVHNMDIKTITLIDSDKFVLTQAQAFLNTKNIKFIEANVEDITQIQPLFENTDMVISAVPYLFNFNLAKLAIETHSHFIDLGGNNDIVSQERTLHTQAQKQGVTVIPDYGLAPGLVSVITRDIVDYFDTIDSVNIRVGGIPQDPQPPLNYQIVFSLEGLINEYVEPALILDHGKIIQKPSLTEIEDIMFPPPFGKMEAFLTSGGCSTLPYTFKNKIGYLDYKTIRYPGHCAMIQPLFELGFAETTPITLNNTTFTPREILKELLRRKIPTKGKDAILLEVHGIGYVRGRRFIRKYQIIDQYDTQNNISAMQRMTGYPIAITADMLLKNQIHKHGVFCPEEIIPPQPLFSELNRRGINIEITVKETSKNTK